MTSGQETKQVYSYNPRARMGLSQRSFAKIMNQAGVRDAHANLTLTDYSSTVITVTVDAHLFRNCHAV